MPEGIIKQGKYSIKDSTKIIIEVKDLLGADNLKIRTTENEGGGDAIRKFVKKIRERIGINKGRIIIDQLWKNMRDFDNRFYLTEDTKVKVKMEYLLCLFKNNKIEVNANHFRHGTKKIARIIEDKIDVEEGDIFIEESGKNIIEIEKPIKRKSLFD